MTLSRFCLLAMLVACLGGIAAHTKLTQQLLRSGSATLVGEAVDVYGRRVTSADVNIRLPSGRSVATARTDDEGRFTFRGCDPGRYHVVITKEGVGAGERIVVLRRGADASTTVALTGVAPPGPRRDGVRLDTVRPWPNSPKQAGSAAVRFSKPSLVTGGSIHSGPSRSRPSGQR